jgi:Xylose isomerase-like TIM barrel
MEFSKMRNLGFSSGAIAYGDFMGALATLSKAAFPCLELSALRVCELEPLIAALPNLDLSGYSYVSFHAPSSYSKDEESWVAEMLYTKVPTEWPIVVHPDAIYEFKDWARFGARIAIENMDRRKAIGRTAYELEELFTLLPEASLCFDIGHARQCDASMTEAFLILSKFAERLVQVHISEVNSASQHDPISHGAKLAFQQIANLIPDNVPIIIESRVVASQIEEEAMHAREALIPLAVEQLV